MQRDSVFVFFCNRIANDHDLLPLEWVKIKFKYANRKQRCDYVMSVIMFALYVTIYEMFAVELCMTLTMAFRMVQSSIWIYDNRKPIYDFLFYGNGIVFIVCYRLRLYEIFAVKICIVLTLTIRMGQT